LVTFDAYLEGKLIIEGGYAGILDAFGIKWKALFPRVPWPMACYCTVHGRGRHFESSGSRLKFVLVM
jgi:hypothetical protein